MSRLRSNSHKTTIINPNPEDDPYFTEYRSQYTYFVDQDNNQENEQEDERFDEQPVNHNSHFNLPNEQPQRLQPPVQNYQENYVNQPPVQYELRAPYKQDDYTNYDQQKAPTPRYQNEPQFTDTDLNTKVVVRDVHRSSFAHYGSGNIKPSNPEHYLHTHNVTAANKVYPEAQIVRSNRVRVPHTPTTAPPTVPVEPPKPVVVPQQNIKAKQDPPAFVPSVNFDSLDKPVLNDTPHYLKGTKATTLRHKETMKQLKHLDEWKQFNTRAVRYVVAPAAPVPQQEKPKPKKKKPLSMYNTEEKSDPYEQNSISLRFKEIEHERVTKPTKSQNALGFKQGSGVSQAINAAQIAHQPAYTEPNHVDNRSYFANPVVEQQQYYQPPVEQYTQQEYSRPSSVSSTSKARSSTFESTQAFAPKNRDHLNPRNYKQFPASVLVNIPAAGVSSPKSPALHIIGTYK